MSFLEILFPIPDHFDKQKIGKKIGLGWPNRKFRLFWKFGEIISKSTKKLSKTYQNGKQNVQVKR